MNQQSNNKRNPLKHPDQRVGVFIDVQNLYYSAKNLYGKKVNFGNIVKEAVGERKLIRAIAYVVRTESKEEQPFFEALYNLGIETREKDLQIFYSGLKKAEDDNALIIRFYEIEGKKTKFKVNFDKTFGTLKKASLVDLMEREINTAGPRIASGQVALEAPAYGIVSAKMWF